MHFRRQYNNICVSKSRGVFVFFTSSYYEDVYAPSQFPLRRMITSISSVLPALLPFILQSKVRGSAPISSPPASTELICHTALASDCYPAIFQPTEHFQRIHDDQSIPPGLHVRMNLATGLKEARLNVPEPPGVSHAELVIIDDLPPPPSIEEDDPAVEIPDLQDQSDSDTEYEHREAYHPAAFNTEESSLFYSSITTLQSTTALSNRELPALSALQDLAHSIHWGAELARDPAVCQTLIFAINSGSAASSEVRSAAALLMGTAIHSNPDALQALLSHRYSSEAGRAPAAIVIAALRDPEQRDIMLKTRTVFLLSQLCQNTEQLHIFLHSRGLDTLLDLFETYQMTPDNGNDKFRAKVANFIYDRILSGLGNANGLLTQSGSENNALGNDQVLTKGLEPWCKAFTNTLKMYETVGMTAERLSPTVEAAFESIKEADQALKVAHAPLRICGDELEL